MTKSETVFWLKIGEKAFGFPFILGAVYIPPENSKYFNESMFDDIASDLLMLKNVHNMPFCLLGDFNARTGVENEISGYSEIEDCANSHYVNDFDYDYIDTEDFQTYNIRLRRCNSDAVINNHGKRFLELCRHFKLIIANGRVGVDKQGDFTCANTSTIDYCAASLELFHVLNHFAVDIFDPFLSDKHNPIVLRLNSESSYEKCKSEEKVKKGFGINDEN